MLTFEYVIRNVVASNETTFGAHFKNPYRSEVIQLRLIVALFKIFDIFAVTKCD